MKKKVLLIVFVVVFVLTSVAFVSAKQGNGKGSGKNQSSENSNETAENLSNTIDTSSFFTKNEGQIKDKSVAYYISLAGGTGYISDNGIAYDFTLSSVNEDDPEKKIKKMAVKESFWGADGKKIDFDISTKEEDLVSTKISYFMGSNQGDWKSEIAAYQSIYLGEFWNNINLKLNAKSNNIEKVFIVNPGGNTDDITLKLKGAENIFVDQDSYELVIQTDSNEVPEVRFSKPFAYQEVDGERVAVFAGYEIKEINGSNYFYGFDVGDYDESLPLVIDPVMAGTYIGGTSYEETRSCGDHVVDDSGNIITVGAMQYSGGYPTTSGAYDETWNGNYDVVISKFNSGLTTLIASTILGGATNEIPSSVRVDSNGKIFVLGGTSSSDFPTTTGAYDETYNGSEDMFVSRLSSDLTTLESSTYLGGTSGEKYVFVGKMLINDSGKVYVSGTTESSNYPTAGSVYDASYNGGYDIAISKFSNDLTSLEASTFVGGSNSDLIDDMVWDDDGDIAAIGSSKGGFPVSGYDTSFGGWDDYIVFKIDADLVNLEGSTYLGGNQTDAMITNFGYQNSGIAVDSSGDVFVTGATSSPDFPTTSGAYDETGNASQNIYDGFISKFSSDLNSLLASTYLGASTGSSYDAFTGIDINSDENPVVIGWTSATDYPTTTGAYSESRIGSSDAILSELSSDLSTLERSTYFGGTGGDYYTKTLTLDSSDNPQFLLTTGSTDFPTSAGAYDTTHGGGTVDLAFVRLSADLRLVSNVAPSDIALSATTILENQSLGTTIGTLSVTDPDAGNTHTYTLGCSSPGVDDSLFSISGTSLLSGAIFNYESPSDNDTDGDYEICVHVDDNDGGTYDENMTITVSNLNETPTDIALSANTIDENEAIGTIIGTLSTVDVDTSDTHTYTSGCATSGDDDSLFQFSSSSLQSAQSFDYESPSDANADNSYEICIRTSDGNGGTYDENFTIIVSDVVENTAASATVNSASQLTNGSGKVLVSIDVSDSDGDVSKIKVEYESDEDGSGDGPWTDATLVGAVTADFGTPVLDNNAEYQISNIQTSSGSNTIQFYWKTKKDIPGSNSTQYIKITANDETLDGTAVTESVYVDNAPPGKPNKPDLKKTSDTGSSDEDDITSDQTPTFQGSCTTGNEIALYANSNIVASGTLCTSGIYLITSESLSQDEYDFSITETDTYGSVSERSDALSVIIDDGESIDIDDNDNTPENLLAEILVDDRVKLTWDDKSETENGYIVERRQGGGSYSQIASIEKDSEEYIDDGLSREAYNEKIAYIFFDGDTWDAFECCRR
ncbi:Ig-like domain-containing protein [Patescibacteria group bacterium]